MGPVWSGIFAVLGALVGGSATYLGVIYSAKATRKREDAAALRQVKLEAYIEALRHLDRLQADKLARALRDDQDETRRAPWFLRIELVGPPALKVQLYRAITYLMIEQSEPEKLPAESYARARGDVLKLMRSDLDLDLSDPYPPEAESR